MALSRQLVLFCVEQRKTWRMLLSRSQGSTAKAKYVAQKAILADVDAGKLPVEELLARGDELLQERLGNLVLG